MPLKQNNLKSTTTPTQKDLNGLFGRDFKAKPKALQYKGRPIDKDRFLNAYALRQAENHSFSHSPIRYNDELIFPAEENEDGSLVTSLKIEPDGTLGAYDENGKYASFKDVDEMIDYWDLDGYSSDEKPFMKKYYYGPQDYDEYIGVDDLDDNARKTYDSYLNWKWRNK